MTVYLTARAAAVLEGAARAAYPRECAGILLGRSRRVVDCRPLVNGAVHARSAFVMAPAEVARSFAEARGRGLEVVGVYHSHPRGQAAPSDQDQSGLPPCCVHVIAAVSAAGVSEVRAFTRTSRSDSLREIPLIVQAPAPAVSA